MSWFFPVFTVAIIRFIRLLVLVFTLDIGVLAIQRCNAKRASRTLLDGERAFADEWIDIPDKWDQMMFNLLNTSCLWALLMGISVPLINRSFSRISSILERLMI